MQTLNPLNIEIKIIIFVGTYTAHIYVSLV